MSGKYFDRRRWKMFGRRCSLPPKNGLGRPFFGLPIAGKWANSRLMESTGRVWVAARRRAAGLGLAGLFFTLLPSRLKMGGHPAIRQSGCQGKSQKSKAAQG